MKREYAEDQNHHHNNIFSHKFRHLTTSSEEADSHTTTTPPPPPPTHDGATIETSRRPRGRPPGSKNKPKPPLIITRDSSSEPSVMSPYVLELPAGADIIQSTATFCRKRNTSLVILTGNGAVTNLTLKQPSPGGATVTFHGRFDILSISATVGGTAATAGFSISVAGPQGQVVGGLVAGPLVTAGTVYLIAATFNNPTFQRLDQEAVSGAPPPSEAAEHGEVAIYSYDHPPPVASDVIWAPTARQAPPPPPPHY